MNKKLIIYPESSFLQKLEYDRLQMKLTFTIADKAYTYDRIHPEALSALFLYATLNDSFGAAFNWFKKEYDAFFGPAGN